MCTLKSTNFPECLYQTHFLWSLRSFLPHLLPRPLPFHKESTVRCPNKMKCPLSEEILYATLVSCIQHVIGFFTFCFSVIIYLKIWPLIFIVVFDTIYFIQPCYICHFMPSFICNLLLPIFPLPLIVLLLLLFFLIFC